MFKAVARGGIIGQVSRPMHFSNRFIVRATFAFLLVGFLALLGIVGMTFWLGERARVHFAEVIEARDTRGSAVELRNAVQTAESSQRGFVLTGNEIYLAPYATAKTLALRHLASLKRSLAPYRESDRMVARLTTIIDEKFAEMDESIALRRDRRDAEALAAVRSNRGKALMDEANVFFSGIVRTADERLTTGVAEQRENARWLRTFSLVGAVIIVIVIGSAAIVAVNYTRALREARDEVSALNAGLEERVRSRTADLARASEEIQHFAHVVSHDLRAPLVSIVGFSAEIERGIAAMRALHDRWIAKDDSTDPIVSAARAAADEDLPEAIGFVRSSARKMEDLVNAILKLAREGRRSLQIEEVPLAEVVDASLAAIRHQLAEAEGEASLDLDLPPIRSDRFLLEQIFGNLLDNAVKYRSPGRPLRIAVRGSEAAGGTVIVEVADNGRGIATHDQERAFDLFRRVGAQEGPGEGIGLAYVRRAVRSLGGEIGLRSELGVGTTFRIVLPRDTETAAATDPVSA